VTAAEFAFAQARIQARHAERPDESQWERLHASATLGEFLVLARASGLRRWVAHIGLTHGPHEIERSLRADFRAYVLEVASFVPERWRPATSFVAGLPLLPLAAVPSGPNGRSRGPLAPAELSSLDVALGHEREGDRLLEKWSSRWRSLWPRASADERRSLRSQLEARLIKLFRSERERPAPVFCHLALTALELERLRGALLRRSLFPDVRSDAAWV
jgi:hypothetical protein